jgi:hypothetical protein
MTFSWLVLLPNVFLCGLVGFVPLSAHILPTHLQVTTLHFLQQEVKFGLRKQGLNERV